MRMDEKPKDSKSTPVETALDVKPSGAAPREPGLATEPRTVPLASRSTNQFSSEYWTEISARPSTGRFWPELPSLNQCLYASGALCLGLAALGLIGPPVADAAQSAIRPYTAAGRKDFCASNLKQLGLAVALYTADHDSLYPPPTYAGAGMRVGWQELLQQRGIPADKMDCPEQGAPHGEGGYAMNPVLMGANTKWLVEPSSVLLIGDRSDRSASFFGVPFKFWPPSEVAGPNSWGPAQIRFSHESEANLLYADGHVGSRRDIGLQDDGELWGGRMMYERASQNILLSRALFQQMGRFVYSGNERAMRPLIAKHRKESRSGYEAASAIWPASEAEARDRFMKRWGQGILQDLSTKKTAPTHPSVSLPLSAADQSLPYVGIYPFDRLLTGDDLNSKSAAQLRLIRNAIFARHGRPFRDAKLRQYFSMQPWYKVDPSWTSADDDRRLNATERQNAALVNKFAATAGWE